MPIRDPSQVCANLRILGVISLINKENFGVFTENDERFVEAFAIFCAMAIRNAAEFERAVVSEAKLKVRIAGTSILGEWLNHLGFSFHFL